MLRPAMTQILKPGESYYKFVVAVAKKAREIAAEAEENHIALGFLLCALSSPAPRTAPQPPPRKG